MKNSLIRIAEHFEGADIFDDASAMFVVREASRTLGWTISKDEFGQLKFIRPKGNK